MAAPAASKRLGVLALVVVGGEGERDEHGGAPHGADLREGGGPCASDDERGVRVGARHVVDEALHLGVHTQLAVARLHLVAHGGAGLVHHAHLGVAQARLGERLGDGLVERTRTLRAAQHQDVGGPRLEADRVGHGPLRRAHEVAPHGVAHQPRSLRAKALDGLVEGHVGAAHAACQQTGW
jgi:hypothetical protein